MYKLLLFSGGVYKFELLVEYIEDIGGLVVQEDRIHISRGSSFLSEEIRVMLIVPNNEKSHVKSFADEIKGNIEELIIEESLKNKLIASLKIYNILCKADNWLNQNEIIDLMENWIDGECIQIDFIDNDSEDNWDDCLELMISLKLIKKRENNGVFEYGLILND